MKIFRSADDDKRFHISAFVWHLQQGEYKLRFPQYNLDIIKRRHLLLEDTRFQHSKRFLTKYVPTRNHPRMSSENENRAMKKGHPTIRIPRDSTNTKGKNDLKMERPSTQCPLSNIRAATLIMFQSIDPPQLILFKQFAANEWLLHVNRLNDLCSKWRILEWMASSQLIAVPNSACLQRCVHECPARFGGKQHCSNIKFRQS